MKYSLLLILAFIVVAHCSFDFTHHKDGHELLVSLKDETQKIWVVFIEAEGGEGNKDVKSAVKNKLLNEDVFYTELDLSADQTKEDYKDFIDYIKLDIESLKEGPTVALVYNKKGYWIHGHGIPQETVDTIHAFILQKEENDKKQSVSVGGSSDSTGAKSYGGSY